MKKVYLLSFFVYSLFNACLKNQVFHEGEHNIDVSEVTHFMMPVLAGQEQNKISMFRLTNVNGNFENVKAVTSIEVDFTGSSDLNDIKNATFFHSKLNNFNSAKVYSSANVSQKKVSFTGNYELDAGDHYFWLSIVLKETPDLTHIIKCQISSVNLNDKSSIAPLEKMPQPIHRIGLILKNKFDDGIDTYRIPGLVTTNTGTLIAVYDNRYNNSTDLQEDIDVGMSRSTDGGQTWEPMKIIMDMGTYGGLSHGENGIGDPAILVDKNSGTIWVAALWLHGHKGKRAWWASDQGLTPEETGQLMLVKSEDDGISWSPPINITKQVKNPEWKLFFNGPGNGITLKDGTLVFAAQFKDKDAIPHSTIIFSKDGGANWEVGTGAKSETTEAQVVELEDGTLMLNMRDDRNRADRKDAVNGRSVATTSDMGNTWVEHPTSRNALIEPNCMASIIAEEINGKGQVLFFSNPNSKTARIHLTIKASMDGGKTWPEEHQIELHEESSYGYSCLTRIDEDNLGILYEGNGTLYFQKIPISDIIH